MQARWEHFPHEADVGIRGIGGTLEEAFAQAAVALTAVVTDPALVAPREAVEISCENADHALLLVDWLNALVYEMAVRKMLFSEFQVHLDDTGLGAIARGEAVDVNRHQPAAEIKGATYTALRVDQDPSGGWVAQCVVDV